LALLAGIAPTNGRSEIALEILLRFKLNDYAPLGAPNNGTATDHDHPKG
jgi:hypothetical protein